MLCASAYVGARDAWATCAKFAWTNMTVGQLEVPCRSAFESPWWGTGGIEQFRAERRE